MIVDVGCGEFPWANDVNRRNLGPDDEYIGIDLFPNLTDETLTGINSLAAQLSEITGGNPLRLERGDATQLPLEDESADEVIFTNIFGYAPVAAQRPAMVAEAVRILKRPYGTITVVETYTPGRMPLEQLRELFDAHGFVQMNPGGERRSENINWYSDPRSDGTSYIATFFRLPPPEEEAPVTSVQVPPSGGGAAGASSTVGGVSEQVGNGVTILDETLPGAQDGLLKLREAHGAMVEALSGNGNAAEAAGAAAVAHAITQWERYGDAITLAQQRFAAYVSAIGGVLSS